MKTATRYNSLNAKQIRILKLLFKFRFITAPLLLEYKQAKSLASINKAIKILQHQEYIARLYKSSFKLQGKGARYYLAKRAITYLRDQHAMDQSTLHAMYKNKSVSEVFIDHHLDVFQAFLNLSASYPATFNTYTKYELENLEYFLSPAPDLYLSRISPLEDGSNDYLLDIFTDTPYFVIKKRFELYVEHYESGDWEAETKTNYPVILIACPDSRGEEKLQIHIERTLDGAGIDDLHIYTTTTKALLTSNNSSCAIWTKTSDTTKILNLNNLYL